MKNIIFVHIRNRQLFDYCTNRKSLLHHVCRGRQAVRILNTYYKCATWALSGCVDRPLGKAPFDVANGFEDIKSADLTDQLVVVDYGEPTKATLQEPLRHIDEA